MIGEPLWQRFNPKEGESVQWYYQSLLEGFEAKAHVLGPEAQPALDELRRTLKELDQLRAVK